MKSTGDGILATFDGPGAPCVARSPSAQPRSKLVSPARRRNRGAGQDVGGIAVHAAARVMAQCGANQVLVSRVVTDLVACAGLKFTERGAIDLKGIPGQWDLFAAAQ